MKTANMSVKEILASNNNGQGKTNTIAETSNVVGDIITFGGKDYNVRQELQSAKLLQYFSRETNAAEVLETLAAGYLGKFHQKTMENGEYKKPAEQVKRLLTADEYLTNCIKLAVIDPVKLYADLTKFNDKATKAELLTFVETLRDSLVTTEQHETFLVMSEKEENLNALKELGFSDFRKFVGFNDNETIKAAISLEDWKTAKTKLEASFKFIVAVPTKSDEFGVPEVFDVTFRELTDAEKAK